MIIPARRSIHLRPGRPSLLTRWAKRRVRRHLSRMRPGEIARLITDPAASDLLRMGAIRYAAERKLEATEGALLSLIRAEAKELRRPGDPPLAFLAAEVLPTFTRSDFKNELIGIALGTSPLSAALFHGFAAAGEPSLLSPLLERLGSSDPAGRVRAAIDLKTGYGRDDGLEAVADGLAASGDRFVEALALLGAIPVQHRDRDYLRLVLDALPHQEDPGRTAALLGLVHGPAVADAGGLQVLVEFLGDERSAAPMRQGAVADAAARGVAAALGDRPPRILGPRWWRRRRRERLRSRAIARLRTLRGTAPQ